jgi:hypothetical protein
MLFNLILAALQPLSAGLSMSGYGGAVTGCSGCTSRSASPSSAGSSDT